MHGQYFLLCVLMLEELIALMQSVLLTLRHTAKNIVHAYVATTRHNVAGISFSQHTI